MKYKLVIFDMDGTILNTLEDLADSMNYCLPHFGMPTRSLDEIRRFIGNGVHKLVERSVSAGADSEAIEGVYKEFTSYYKAHCSVKTGPYDGVCEAIAELRSLGYKTSVASNKVEYIVKSLCDEMYDGLFDYCAGNNPDRRVKPYPDIVEDTLSYFGLQPADAVYVGDTNVDYETAKNSGLDLILVDWGYRSREELEALGDEIIVSSPQELVEILR